MHFYFYCRKWICKYFIEDENAKKILWLRNNIKEKLHKKLNIDTYTDNQTSKFVIENGKINIKFTNTIFM